MNPWFLIASILSYVLGIGHSVLGEWVGDRVLVKRIQGIELFEEAEKDVLGKRVVRLAWHATSIMWCGFGTLLLYAAFIELDPPIISMMRIISLIFLLTSLLSLMSVPRKAWLFLAISITAWMGTC
jgi:hypothetical protein